MMPPLHVLCFALCLVSGPLMCQTSRESLDRNILFRLSKEPCRGTCPVYMLTVFANRQVLYHAQDHVKSQGIFSAKLSKKELQRLVSLFEDKQFLSLDPLYPAAYADIPVTKLYFSSHRQGKSLQVKFHENGPPQLRVLSTELEKLIQSLPWKPVKE
jgi:hypothetical protein